MIYQIGATGEGLQKAGIFLILRPVACGRSVSRGRIRRMKPTFPDFSVFRGLTVACLVAAASTMSRSEAAAPPAAPPQAKQPADAPQAGSGIPASDKTVADALKNSPRHGEWVDIALPGSEVKLKTWVVYPESKAKAPIVLVIHEIFGLTDWVRGVADQLAADGFIALAPDLLSGMGPDGGGTESLGDQVGQTIRKIAPDDVAARLNAVRDYGLKLPAARGDKSACIGFCWGGSASFNYAVRQPKLNAAVVYYGTAPMTDGKPDTAALGKIACPVLGCYGGDDARVTATVEPTAAAMGELKKTFTHREYDAAGHGFLRQSSADQRNGANLKAAQSAWKETIEFLHANTH